MAKKVKIFMVEDDKNFGAVLKSYLEINDYQVTLVDDGKCAIEKFKSEEFDICILDIMLPNKDGFTIAKEIKQINPNMPFIFLTAKTLKVDILNGFKIGADDYITKPFDSEILLYKIQAILNRSKNSNQQMQEEFSIGIYKFNYKLRTIKINEKTQALSPKEAELLKQLCLNVNNIIPREETLKLIWGDDNYFTTRSMDVFMTKLRKYLKEDPNIEIVNIHGSGFRLIVNK